MSNTTVETIVGAIVLIIAGLFLYFAQMMVGFGGQSNGYTLTAEFDNVEGINVGTDIRLAGIKVGTVKEQKLNTENYQAVIAMTIEPNVKLTEDTSAKVTAEGLLGAKFIALEPGGSDALLGDGGFITSTQGAVDIWSLISQAMFDKSSKAPAAGATAPAPITADKAEPGNAPENQGGEDTPASP